MTNSSNLRIPDGARDDILDFVKGALVVLMVVYHWLNYFIGFQSDAYRYIRFLTPSFVLISGFVVSHVYMRKYRPDSGKLARRLIQRGLKLVFLFAVLNAAAVLPDLESQRLRSYWADQMTSVIVFGVGNAAFTILLTIGYFLIVAPLVLRISAALRVSLAATAIVAMALTWICTLLGSNNAHAELLSIGLLGLAAGAARGSNDYERRIGPMMLAALYALYLAALITWDVIFPVQVIAVCVNLLVLQRLGVALGRAKRLPQWVVNLGRYSLFAYIGQIVILRLLRQAMPQPELSTATLIIVFVIALIATVASVRLMALLRERATVADYLYRTVFA